MKDYKVFITEGTSGGLVHGRVKDTVKDFSGGSVVKNLPANAGDVSSIPGSGISSREGNGELLYHSRLGNPMDRRE